MLYSTQASTFLLESRFQSICSLMTDLKIHLITTIQNCVRLLGYRASCSYVIQHMRLHLRPLQIWLVQVYSPSCLHRDTAHSTFAGSNFTELVADSSQHLCRSSLPPASTVNDFGLEHIGSRVGSPSELRVLGH